LNWLRLTLLCGDACAINGFRKFDTTEKRTMSLAATHGVLADAFGPREGYALRLKQAALVMGGIGALAISAKINVPMWPSPVPITLGTFAVLSIGASFGARLGLVTIMGYMLIGALGFDVFASSSAQMNGFEYMTGGTGGYLVGYVLATLALGLFAQRGLDRSVIGMTLALVVGNALIYIPGLLWLTVLYGVEAPILQWGLFPFLVGDLVKLALAALLLPALWKMVGKARG
jgi:biotin transport system substrate-specific component